MDLFFTIDQLLTILGLIVATIGFCFTVIKYFNAQLHARITHVEEDAKSSLKDATRDIKAKIDDIETKSATKKELSDSIETIKDLIKSLKEDQHRMATRLDDMFKWMMEKNG